MAQGTLYLTVEIFATDRIKKTEIRSLVVYPMVTSTGFRA